MKEEISSESIRELYFSEHTRHQTIRSQLAVPGSVISFSIFGYVSFAQYFNATKFDGITIAMIILMIFSLVFLFLAIVFLARVELGFLSGKIPDTRDKSEGETERQFFQKAYSILRQQNAVAATRRAWSLLLLLGSLGCFVSAVALLPLHLNDTKVNGRNSGTTSKSSNSAQGTDTAHG